MGYYSDGGSLLPDTSTATIRGYDPGDTPARAVVEAVTRIKETDAESLDPLYGAVDPDALNALCEGSREADLVVSFTYEGCEVQVESDGSVIARELED